MICGFPCDSGFNPLSILWTFFTIWKLLTNVNASQTSHRSLFLKVTTIFEKKENGEHSDCTWAVNPQLIPHTAVGQVLWRLRSWIFLVKPDAVSHIQIRFKWRFSSLMAGPKCMHLCGGGGHLCVSLQLLLCYDERFQECKAGEMQVCRFE